MLVNKSRDKLIHSIVFFVTNTKNCNKLKLFKLLYFLDMDHYKATGRPVTSLHYFAWPMGPVPKELFEEIDKPKEDFKKFIKIIPQSFLDPDFKVASPSKAIIFKPTVTFNEKIFSPRELKLMNRLVEIYKDVGAKDISEISHAKGDPWDRVFNIEKNKQAEIPFIYALDMTDAKITKEQAEEAEDLSKKAKEMFG
jgi:uncharacterized phage-associated protein